mmetsp:Transcript_27689/g.69632  ORF Transcript_27689/g.69632 Transcript_27689/m.69632 type:complete len:87 (-) Transcript_27689:23-283(-)
MCEGCSVVAAREGANHAPVSVARRRPETGLAAFYGDIAGFRTRGRLEKSSSSTASILRESFLLSCTLYTVVRVALILLHHVLVFQP